jgi:hypothetical protein
MSFKLTSPYGPQAKLPAVRALTVSPVDEDIVIGTAACDITEVIEHRQVCKLDEHACCAGQRWLGQAA